jgi:hypothetical protein
MNVILDVAEWYPTYPADSLAHLTQPVDHLVPGE